MVRSSLAATLLAVGRAQLSAVSLAGVDPLAVCSDGKPAFYYFKPTTAAPTITCDQCPKADECNCGFCGSYGGCSFTCGKATSEGMPPRGQRCARTGEEVSPVSEASRTWLVYLEPGGWCSDEADCKRRCSKSGRWPTNKTDINEMCTSEHNPDMLSKGGIFWPDTNEDLKNANKAFVKYCTSDAHMGDATAFGFEFRGKRVVQAVLKHLVENKGLGSGLGGRRDRLIFGGASAGARGAMVHLDYVGEMLGEAAPNIDVVGFLDSPAWINMDPYSTSFPGFKKITQDVHSYANVKHLGEECAARHTGEDQWKCMFGQYRLPTLQTPYFLVASQYDSYWLGNQVGGDPLKGEWSDRQYRYADEFVNATRELGSSLARRDGVAVYSWACYNHAKSGEDKEFNAFTCASDTAPSATMDSAFKQYLEKTSATDLYQDNCGSFGCGQCGKGMASEALVESVAETAMVVV